ncbi:MAG: hypothetical protein JWM37_617 [Candidatus Saccharibacteria bacterium]|nr:hypothetical protein [Candidatus Saccharibacteria bacterium]
MIPTMELKQRLTELLKDNHIIQVATSGPWICTVHGAVGDDLTIYWISKPDRRHSRELAVDPRAAVAVFVQPWPQIGIQAEGSATEVTGDDLVQAVQVYADSLNKDQAFRDGLLSGENPHRVYAFTATSWKLFDRENYPDSDVQEVQV